MGRIIEHTPSWLTRPSPGFNAFQPVSPSKTSVPSLNNGQGKKLEHHGPLRTIARRGTEVFVANGNELKYADLVVLKELGQTAQTANGDAFKILKTSVAGQIRQLAISPLGDYLAIATSHTVHISLLPTNLKTSGAEPIRLRTFQLGPTAHVLEQAPVTSLLWHPLGRLGSCLVTVATDACVRLWELDPDSRHSFDEPALALDLKKLANATSANEDLRASVYGTSKGYSPDSVEMEVAAAAFGGIGSPEEHGWAPMTLWVAMTEGDVYALCPFLPSRWQPAHSTLPSLSTDVVSKVSDLDSDDSITDAERRNATRQQDWLANLDAQDSVLVTLPGSYESVEIYSRPANPPAIPKLQGPFRVTPDPELDDNIADIHVIAPRVDAAFVGGEDAGDEDARRAELSVGLICLLSKTGTIHVCLDVNGVEAQWLPAKKTQFQKTLEPEPESLDLILLEKIEVADGQEDGNTWPAFTPMVPDRYTAESALYATHPAGRYGFLVTAATGVVACTLTPWLTDLEDELCGPIDSGSTFRAGLLYESEKSLVEQIITAPANLSIDAGDSLCACITLLDADLGQFILTSIKSQPYAASLELPLQMMASEAFAPNGDRLPLPGLEPREVYQPHPAFFAASTLPSFIETLTQSGASRLKRADMKSNVRLSPATLQLLTEAHRVLSTETNKLGLAAADLFRRCQRMQAELVEQISKVNELAARADSVVDADANVQGGARKKLDCRMDVAASKAGQLKERVDTLRKRLGGLGGKERSKREEAWAIEVQALEKNMDGGDDGSRGSTAQRFEAVQRLSRDVVGQAKEAAKTAEMSVTAAPVENVDDKDEVAARRSLGVYSNDFRKQKLQHVMALLERETALVDAVTERLERLSGLAG